jgi:hypothetical protein
VVVEISEIPQDARKLTQAVIQVVDMLDLYQAELARILHLQCSDIGLLANAQELLVPGSEAWDLAGQFVRFYRLLYRHRQADGIAMRHWLRRRHDAFGETPHLLLVDEDRLDDLIEYLQTSK